MNTFRTTLLETFGIEHDFTAIGHTDIKLQHLNAEEPFGEIVTNDKGKTTLRVGHVLSNGPTLTIK
ncbi:hypothetical protein Xoosp13_116 [Xanthomonas phage Xoo-sp13]|nr:hypothetical protein Xoosp13_116 [Xanthomonas phage Xoo-sp13]